MAALAVGGGGRGNQRLQRRRGSLGPCLRLSLRPRVLAVGIERGGSAPPAESVRIVGGFLGPVLAVTIRVLLLLAVLPLSLAPEREPGLAGRPRGLRGLPCGRRRSRRAAAAGARRRAPATAAGRAAAALGQVGGEERDGLEGLLRCHLWERSWRGRSAVRPRPFRRSAVCRNT